MSRNSDPTKPGWYPHRYGDEGMQSYWNGSGWTGQSRSKPGRKLARWSPWPLLVAGLATVVYGFAGYVHIAQFEREGVEASAFVVSDPIERRDRYTGTKYIAEIEYSTQSGVTYRRTFDVGGNATLGDSISIFYLSSDPLKIELRPLEDRKGTGTMAIGSVVLLVGILGAVVYVRSG